ncbi:DUF7144 family membrane protein [Kitasatospora azatica]|uniref:DUF7144 family membrane protein n=1 Tax=Kitasatospora azatica TaxID=58347 RepID=UPI000564BF88|nr:hypothetical protein [Kitasatospora azatica]
MSTPTRSRNTGLVTGLVLFAGVMMLINGLLDVFQGIVAVAKDQLIVSTPRYVFRFSVTSWGWIHIVLGALVAVAGFGVLTGAAWARIVGILLTAISAIGAFLWLPYYPLWNLVVIALDVFVIWALCVYREDEEA